ncbi:MAG: acyltransferase family protein [Pseudomonadota bacterium]
MQEKPKSFSHPTYRPDIDGLRAIAVLSVVAFHAFPDLLQGGFIGVDIFFVISGFLISTIIFSNLDSGSFSFREFYSRRIRRIFPALLIVLIGCFVFGWFALLSDEFKQLTKHIAAGAGFASNFVLLKEAGYFDNSADTKPLLHLWSLGIEEQFYIIWPFLIWVAYKLRFKTVALLAAIALASFVLNLCEIKQDAVATFYLPQTRFWELLSGGILAWFALYRDSWAEALYPSEKIVRNIASFAGIVLLIAGFCVIRENIGFPGKWAVIPVLGTVLLIAAGSDAIINQMFLSRRITIWFGVISFPLYLWHWPLLSFVRVTSSEVPSWQVRAIVVLVSIGLATATYWLIERPIRYGGFKQIKTVALFASMAVVGCVAYYDFTSNIFPARAARIAQQIGWNNPVGTPIQVSSCREKFAERNGMSSPKRDDNFCYLQKNGEPNVLLVGDSMNLSLFPGLARYNDYNIVMLSASKAVPFFNVRTTEFNDVVRKNNYLMTNQALNYALRSNNIRVVVMSSVAGPELTSPNNPFKITDINDENNANEREVFSSAMTLTLKKLQKAGKNVIFVLPNAILPFDIKDCLSSWRPIRLSNNHFASCSEPISWHSYNISIYKDWVFSVLKAFPAVKVFDASAPLCDAKKCYGMDNDQIFYRDRQHLSISGSNLVAPALHKMIIDALNHQMAAQ